MPALRFLLFIWLISVLPINTLHAQWVQMGGLSDAVIRCLLISDTTIFAGTDDRGVYRSTENSTNWTEINNGLTPTFILALAENGSNLFAGAIGGTFISTNNGNIWTEINNGLTNKYVNAIAAIGPTLFTATNDSGVFISTNNGSSWTTVNTGLTNKTITSLAVSPNGVGGSNIIAGTFGGGVFLSTNDGASWTAMNNGLTSSYVRKFAVIPNGTGGSDIYAGTYHDGVFLSTNNGSSWTAINTGLTDHSILSLACSGLNIFVGTDGGGIFLSTDKGTSWTAVNTGLINQNIMSLGANGSYLFAGTFSAGTWKRPLSEMIVPSAVSMDKLIKEFCLEQNYPNPFNPKTVISYKLSVNSKIVMKVYDILGREIATLVNGMQSAGKYTVEWNAQNSPGGVYFYRLSAGSYTETKKLILLK